MPSSGSATPSCPDRGRQGTPRTARHGTWAFSLRLRVGGRPPGTAALPRRYGLADAFEGGRFPCVRPSSGLVCPLPCRHPPPVARPRRRPAMFARLIALAVAAARLLHSMPRNFSTGCLCRIAFALRTRRRWVTGHRSPSRKKLRSATLAGLLAGAISSSNCAGCGSVVTASIATPIAVLSVEWRIPQRVTPGGSKPSTAATGSASPAASPAQPSSRPTSAGTATADQPASSR